jgi:hypothetical protein
VKVGVRGVDKPKKVRKAIGLPTNLEEILVKGIEGGQ